MLSGPEKLDLKRVLQRAFTDYQDLSDFLEGQGVDLKSIANERWRFPEIVSKATEYWLTRKSYEQLVIALYQERQENQDVVNLYKKVTKKKISSLQKSIVGAEVVIRQIQSFQDPLLWAFKLQHRVRQICRIEVYFRKGNKNFKSNGTGFLIGPNIVLTNDHVVHPIEDTPPSKIDVFFDYVILEDGTEYQNPNPYYVSKIIDFSPWSQVDSVPEPKTAVPSLDELDYAVLEINKSVGNERGWMGISESSGYIFEPQVPLYILQHPLKHDSRQQQPLKLAVGSILGQNANETRLLYHTNSRVGSSGSPCLDSEWNLVALHHFGDPKPKRNEYNQGIPIKAIAKRLVARGFSNLINQSVSRNLFF